MTHGTPRIRAEKIAAFEGLTDRELAMLCDLRLAEEWHDAERNKQALLAHHPELRVLDKSTAA